MKYIYIYILYQDVLYCSDGIPMNILELKMHSACPTICDKTVVCIVVYLCVQKKKFYVLNWFTVAILYKMRDLLYFMLSNKTVKVFTTKLFYFS